MNHSYKKGALLYPYYTYTKIVLLVQWANKRNDHAARSGCADFFNISPKRAVLGKNEV